MTESHRTTKTVGATHASPVPAKSGKTAAEYESARREIIAKYNSLLADARGRLLAAIQRVQQGRMKADKDTGLELTHKIQELIDYLDQARL